jgi:hypothetical protein
MRHRRLQKNDSCLSVDLISPPCRTPEALVLLIEGIFISDGGVVKAVCFQPFDLRFWKHQPPCWSCYPGVCH